MQACAAASLPTPHATRRRSPSCWQCCPECCQRRESQTLAKWAFRGVCPCPVQPLHNHFPNHPTTTPTITQPRLNHPSCRIQERFRLNHPTSTILQLRLNHNQAKRNGAAELPRETKFVDAHLCSIRIFGIILMFPRGSRSVSWRKGSPYGGEDPAISFYERY